jgi:hypothetical protein
VALGDLDGDGDLDVLIPAFSEQDSDEVWFNDGHATFTQSGQSLGTASQGQVALGDLDGDGDLDVLFNDMYPLAGSPGQVWLNDGTGVLTTTGQRLEDSDTYENVLGDLDGDGDLDAFAADGSLGANYPNQVWLNDGAGVFTSPYPGLGDSCSTGAALGDLDGDGDLDAFVVNYGDQPDEVWLNDGSGRFADSGQRLESAHSWDVELGDLDGDGDLDAFVANGDATSVEAGVEPSRVWLNDGAGRFTGSLQRLGDAASLSVALGDLDGDGDLDALAANAHAGLYWTPGGASDHVWLNTQPQVFLPLVMAKNEVFFMVESVRQLTPCENEGKHHIFVHVLDQDSAGLPGIPLKICWGTVPDDCARPLTDAAGWVEFAMFRGVYSVQVDTGISQVASGLTGDFAMDEACEITGNPVANSRYHISFEVIFRREP